MIMLEPLSPKNKKPTRREWVGFAESFWKPTPLYPVRVKPQYQKINELAAAKDIESTV